MPFSAGRSCGFPRPCSCSGRAASSVVSPTCGHSVAEVGFANLGNAPQADPWLQAEEKSRRPSAGRDIDAGLVLVRELRPVAVVVGEFLDEKVGCVFEQLELVVRKLRSRSDRQKRHRHGQQRDQAARPCHFTPAARWQLDAVVIGFKPLRETAKNILNRHSGFSASEHIPIRWRGASRQPSGHFRPTHRLRDCVRSSPSRMLRGWRPFKEMAIVTMPEAAMSKQNGIAAWKHHVRSPR